MKALETTKQRLDFGKAVRKQLRREDHATWKPKDRRHDPLRLLQASMRGRVPALIPLKYERMSCSPFTFFRGAVPIMAADLAGMPHTGIHCQLCGDAHVHNLGAYAGPDGRLLFDINDFDETIRGPFEWDLKRLATSLVLAGREDGAKDSASSEAVLTFAGQYRETMQTLSELPVITLARYQVHGLDKIGLISQVLLKAERATPMLSLERLTKPKKPKSGPKGARQPARVFSDEKPVRWRLAPAEARPVLDSLRLYRESLAPDRQHFLDRYRAIDVAFKIVGTGSVGLRDYVIYFEGNGPGDPLFLQVKEEPPSAYARYLGAARTTTAHGRHQGRRVALGQRAMQFQSDLLLGWSSIAGRDFLVRQLNDHKGSIDVADLSGGGLLAYAHVCGELLARGHARSGDPAVLAGYIGGGDNFDRALAGFAVNYADQTEADWHALLKSKRP